MRERWGALRRLVSLAVMAGTGAACLEDVDKPAPPDMEEIVSLYSEPTAALTADNIDDLQLELAARLSVLRDVCGWNDEAVRDYCAAQESCYLCSGLDPLTETFQSLSTESDGSQEVRKWVKGLDGFLRVVRICRGWDEEPSLELENGYTELVIGFTENGFDPIFGGKIVGCQILLDGERATVEGELDLAVDAPFYLHQLPELEPVVEVRGLISSGGQETGFHANFRVSAIGGGDLALGFEVGDDGTMVASTGRSGLGVIAANGRFSCELAPPARTQLTCRNIDTGETIP